MKDKIEKWLDLNQIFDPATAALDGTKIRQQRKEFGYASAEALADQCKIAENTVVNAEKGKPVKRHTIDRICRILGLSPVDLVLQIYHPPEVLNTHSTNSNENAPGQIELAGQSNVIELVAIAQGFKKPRIQKITKVFRESKSHRIHRASKRVNDSLLIIAKLLETVVRFFALGSNRAPQCLRSHCHIANTIFNKHTKNMQLALVPIASFTSIRTQDTFLPVFVDNDWYAIAKCFTSGRTTIEGINLNARPQFEEALEVPAVECVFAHPLRRQNSNQVIGTLSFDCFTRYESMAKPQKAIVDLKWGEAGSNRPNELVKGIAIDIETMINRLLNLNELGQYIGVMNYD